MGSAMDALYGESLASTNCRGFLNGASIFLGPSLTEGFPLPPAEAAACGCAIVATDIGGHQEYLEHGVSALLSPPKDPAAMARNLCLLLANDNLRMQLALGANKSVTRFSWEHNTDLFERFLRRVSPKAPMPSNVQNLYSPAAASGACAEQLAE